MTTKPYLFIFISALLFFSCKEKQPVKSIVTTASNAHLKSTLNNVLNTGVAQYKYMADQLRKGEFPKTYNSEKNKLETSGSDWWCSGFYAGSLLLLDKGIGAPTLKQEAQKSMAHLKKEQFNSSTHDLGFMMYCSFGNALAMQENKEYEQILLNSAKSLSTRYNDKVKAIRSWDNAPWNKGNEGDLIAIIDNMMNLELLFWATRHTNDSTYYNIAVNHANTTMNNHFRDDYSSYHVVIYDEKTGAVQSQITNQGAADESSWSRGQAWGLYGYTVMYRETGDLKYLRFAENIADYILNHPNLPSDKIPYWDFNAPQIPNALRDSSAAAIIASALLELSTFDEVGPKDKYLHNAELILQQLSTPEYIANNGENGGFLLKHGVGNMPNKTEIDVPLTYGDYYLIEAILRYLEVNT
ncbi:glycoside hydrolase family 88 protein [Maribacter sp. MMG018]|uniref:glycoside hydrolase family 88 protein n=1 Tax=Maribacter sp. MMG018 TaxID=2822688 RepID=UPI001B35A85C|nr:glycoside hydrolase family 88 protein [Maribacter sp. MMG018]MBQ4914324.1 glycoside hydrolase family 88 protein [Maribacter sp. MMG018]